MRITEYTRGGGGSLREGQKFIFVTIFKFYNSTVTQSGRLNLNKLLPPMRFPIVRHLSFCFAGLSRQRKFVKGKGHQSLLLSLCNWAVWTYHKLGFRPGLLLQFVNKVWSDFIKYTNTSIGKRYILWILIPLYKFIKTDILVTQVSNVNSRHVWLRSQYWSIGLYSCCLHLG